MFMMLKVDLQRGELEQLVADDLGVGAALALDDEAHAVAAGVVVHVGDVGDLLLLHAVDDLIDDRGLEQLVGDLVDDDEGLVERAAARVFGLDVGAPADGDLAAAGGVAVDDAGHAADRAAGGEVGAGHDLHELGRA